MTWSRAGRAALVALCAYEITAVATHRVPTVSDVCRKRRWVEAALIGAAIAHLHQRGADE